MNKELLKNKNLLLLVFGNATSIFGDIFLEIALSLYILKISGSAEQFGSILALGVIPRLLFAPFAGVLVDRFNKRNFAIFLDVIRIVFLTGLLFWIKTFGISIIAVYVTILFLAACDIFFRPCFISLIPATVKKKNIISANMLMRVCVQIASIIAPVLAAFFFNIYGLIFIIIVDLLTYTVSVIAEVFISIPKAETHNAGKELNILKDISDGFKIIFNNIQITSILINGTLTHLFLFPFLMIGIPFLLIKVYGAPDIYYGIVESWATIGTFISIFFVGLAKKRNTIGTNINIGIIAMISVSFLFILFTFDNVTGYFTVYNNAALFTFCLITFLMFLAFGFYGVFFSSFYQINVPDGYLGRFTAAFQFSVAVGRFTGYKLFGMLFERSVKAAVLVMIGGVLLKIFVHIPFLTDEKKAVAGEQ